ncbi:PREDICTED: uncharacterized protein LOC104391886 [Chaetura pelagica]|uniref:uncharacterized protein LOC104391886 n=1 Tax=Chaetura pelagica TaxID=8897 RepID=UPI00052314B3|nr:PREDICTED: uncharacterized protein LOC104391886 [Chaetura pelagica]
MEKLNLNAVPSVVTANTKVESCMYSHLKTFADTLAGLDRPSRFIARKLNRVQEYKSILPKNNVLEEERNLTTYLERFIKVLKNSKKWSKTVIPQNLQKIRDAVKSCPEWMEQDWEPMEEKDFFSNLEYLLRFLNHYAPSEDTGSGTSSYSLPLKETPDLQNTTRRAIIDEMICLLEAEKESINGNLFIPLHIKKSSSNDKECRHVRSSFSRFKEYLEKFLRWVNQEESCRNILTSESGSHPDDNCTCLDFWKYSKGLF